MPRRYEDILAYTFSVEGITEKGTAEEYTYCVAYGRGMCQQAERQTGHRGVNCLLEKRLKGDHVVMEQREELQSD